MTLDKQIQNLYVRRRRLLGTRRLDESSVLVAELRAVEAEIDELELVEMRLMNPDPDADLRRIEDALSKLGSQ